MRGSSLQVGMCDRRKYAYEQGHWLSNINGKPAEIPHYAIASFGMTYLE